MGAGSHLAIVPAYNESVTVAAVVAAIRAAQPHFDVLVVDDGSLDRTRQAAESAGAYVVRHPYNLGIGGAVQSGFIFAAENGYKFVVQVDGDGQHDPAEITRLELAMAAAPNLDVVCGSRFIQEYSFTSTFMRRCGIKLFGAFLSRVVGRAVTDPTSGFRLYNRRAIELFARDYPHDYPEVEAVLMAHAHKLQMGEVAVEMVERQGGESSINAVRSVYYMVKVTLALVMGLLRRPTVLEVDSSRQLATR